MIACICLQERDDRFLEVSEQFHEYGLCRLVEFYRPSRPSLTECEKLGIQRRGGYGVWSSHRHVILKTLQHKLSRCLTFEDDAVLFSKRMSVSKLEQMINDVDALEENWGAFKLGHCAQIGYFVSPSVVRTWSFLTQAVLWSQTGMEKLRDCTYVQYYQRKGKEGEIDCWMMGAMNMYATFPQLVHQSDSDTNNLNSKEDDAWYRDKIMKFQRQILNKCNAVADIAARPADALDTQLSSRDRQGWPLRPGHGSRICADGLRPHRRFRASYPEHEFPRSLICATRW